MLLFYNNGLHIYPPGFIMASNLWSQCFIVYALLGPMKRTIDRLNLLL